MAEAEEPGGSAPEPLPEASLAAPPVLIDTREAYLEAVVPVADGGLDAARTKAAETLHRLRAALPAVLGIGLSGPRLAA